MSDSIRIEEALATGCPYRHGMCLYRFEDPVLEQAFYRDSFGLPVVSDETGLHVGGVRVVVEPSTAGDTELSLLNEVLVEIAS
jgi:hypothetical protein